MNRLLLAMSLLLVFLALAATPLHARPTVRLDERTGMCRYLDRGPLAWESEPWGTGGQKFQEVCKSCHAKGSGMGAPFLHEESYTSAGWNRIFAKRRKACARDGSWDKLSEKELLLINDYLYRNGAWTYDPNDADTCG